MLVAVAAAQAQCFDSLNGEEIMDCVCDSTCLTCVPGEPPSPEDCLSCMENFELAIPMGGISETGSCLMKDFDDFMGGDESASAAHNGLRVTALGAFMAAALANF